MLVQVLAICDTSNDTLLDWLSTDPSFEEIIENSYNKSKVLFIDLYLSAHNGPTFIIVSNTCIKNFHKKKFALYFQKYFVRIIYTLFCLDVV